MLTPIRPPRVPTEAQVLASPMTELNRKHWPAFQVRASVDVYPRLTRLTTTRRKRPIRSVVTWIVDGDRFPALGLALAHIRAHALPRVDDAAALATVTAEWAPAAAPAYRLEALRERGLIDVAVRNGTPQVRLTEMGAAALAAGRDPEMSNASQDMTANTMLAMK